MQHFSTTLTILFITVLLYTAIVFGISRYLDKRDDFADTAWGSMFALLAVTSFGMYHSFSDLWSFSGLATILVLIWSIRLTVSISKRFISSKQEDPRYSAMRAKWSGNVQLQSFVRIFMLQGVLAFVIVLPVIFINANNLTANPFVVACAALWLIGFVIEAIGDAQLRTFVRQPSNKGKLMTTGLWKYSRHPNYFGELMQWWALGLLALNVPNGWIGLAGPLLLTLLITKISGVPLAEARQVDKPQWQAYKARTSVLIPWFPGKK